MNAIATSQGAHQGPFVKLEKGNLVPSSHHFDHNRKTALDLERLLFKHPFQYLSGYKMFFTSNHDENAWAGTEMKRMGYGHQAFAVLMATCDGMPLIFSGQESASDKQLAFFSKDEINWGTYNYHYFYKQLLTLKAENQALWNGAAGGRMEKVYTGKDEDVFVMVRKKNDHAVCVLVNLSSTQHHIEFPRPWNGPGVELFSRTAMVDTEMIQLVLEPWGFKIYSTQ
jgi:hypothetical protein